jgi:dethiobiotin synthetase
VKKSGKTKSSKNKGIFVTATDTGVGKTFVASSLAYLLRKKGINVGVMKPFATGTEIHDDKFKSQDTALLARAADVNDSDIILNPVFFPVAASPLMASVIMDQKVNLAPIRGAYSELETRHDFLIVEGIGGIMVPLTPRHLLAHFARFLGLPLIIVSRPNLGSINHTLLTVNACIKYGLEVCGIVINRMPLNANTVESMTPDLIHKLTGIPISAVIPEQHRARYELGSQFLRKWTELSGIANLARS